MAIRTITIIQKHYLALQGYGWFWDELGVLGFNSSGSASQISISDLENPSITPTCHRSSTSISMVLSSIRASWTAIETLYMREMTLADVDVDFSTATIGAAEDPEEVEEERNAELEFETSSLDSSLSLMEFDPPLPLQNQFACGVGLGISGLLSKDGSGPFTGLGVISVRPFAWRHKHPSSGMGSTATVTSTVADSEAETERVSKRYCHDGRTHPDFRLRGDETVTPVHIQTQTLDIIPECDCNRDVSSLHSSSPSPSLSSVMSPPPRHQTPTQTETIPTQLPMLTPTTNSTSDYCSNRHHFTSIPPLSRPTSNQTTKGSSFAAPTISSELKKKNEVLNPAFLRDTRNRGQRRRHSRFHGSDSERIMIVVKNSSGGVNFRGSKTFSTPGHETFSSAPTDTQSTTVL